MGVAHHQIGIFGVAGIQRGIAVVLQLVVLIDTLFKSVAAPHALDEGESSRNSEEDGFRSECAYHECDYLGAQEQMRWHIK